MPYRRKGKGPARAPRARRRPRRTVRRYAKARPAFSPAKTFGRSQVVRHRYSTAIELDPATSTAADYYFRANSLFDPDHTSTGHQPMWHDQMALFYKKYVVIGSRISVRVYGANTAHTGVPLLVIKKDHDNTPASADINTIVESNHRDSCYRYVKSDGTWTFARLGFSLKKDFGIKDPIEVPETHGTSAAGPTKEMLYHVAYADAAWNDTTTVYAHVVIDYLALWFEPIDVIAS